MSEILTHLSDVGYGADNILSQSYDWAFVMTGKRGGLQALLQNKLAIPYIHCYNHLHLVVVHAIQTEPCVKIFFNLSSSLYKFFQHYYVSEKQSNLKELLKIWWTSHYEVTKCIVDSQDHILSILSEMTKDDGAAVDLSLRHQVCYVKLRGITSFTLKSFRWFDHFPTSVSEKVSAQHPWQGHFRNG